ncbi:MAG: cell division protein DivIVA [Ignavibacteria bacterium RBG_16_36_9]|nr:MAG: cell division protein DivIVA [Ignavibacteria bacterium RBG_16_36_9]
MKLSPLLIKKQEFEKSFRGYNVDEVQTFLDKISSEMEDLINENEALEQEVENLNAKVIEYQKIEKNLKDTFLKNQETLAQALESAKKQSALIVKEAEIKASQIIQNAEDIANEMRNAVIALREEKDSIIARLKAIVSTQSNLLEGKVKDAGEEPRKTKTQDEPEKFDIDIDGIVDKLL